MTVLGTVDEINEVIQYFRPGYPRQNLESLEANQCFYILNEVPVEIVIYKNFDVKECVKA